MSDAALLPAGPVPQGVAHWYALRVMSNREFRVRADLAAMKIATFLPTWAEKTQWSDRAKIINRPLFPGYLFVRARERGELHAAMLVAGVVQVLPNSLMPEPIDEQEIENVRVVMASRLKFEPCEFVAGELVTIESGPLAGVSGVVKKTKGALRVVVSVELLRRAIAVELDAATLVKRSVDA